MRFEKITRDNLTAFHLYCFCFVKKANERELTEALCGGIDHFIIACDEHGDMTINVGIERGRIAEKINGELKDE